jgi:hypothetical protein
MNPPHPLPVIAALLLVLPLAAAADPLPAGRIPAQVKWVLHLDADGLRRTRVGESLIRNVLEPKSAQAKADLKKGLDFDLDWNRLHSVTAFGSNYEPRTDTSAVVLIHGSMDVIRALETAEQRNSTQVRPKKLEAGPTPLYRINDESYVWAGPQGWFLLAKSREALAPARAAFTGTGSRLNTTGLLQGYPPAPEAFLLVGLADDFGQKATLPPQAAVLKQAEGGRLLVGERNGFVFADLGLRTQTPEAALQIQQVVQGLAALSNLNPESNPDLQQLAQSARVSVADRLVTLSVQVPVARAVEKLAEGK